MSRPVVSRPFPSFGLGWLPAFLGLIITIVLIAVGHIAIIPEGLLFLLVFLALLL